MEGWQDQMRMEMELRNFSPKTVEAYLGQANAFVKLFGKSPVEMGEDEIRRYMHHLKTVKKVSSSSINIGYCALRFYYEKVLHRQWNTERLPRPKKEKKLPEVLSRGEVQKILAAVADLRHRVMLMIAYGAGLRESEIVHLRITDIDSQRMLIRVAQGKGKKDRYTLLSPVLLEHLRTYYKACRPKVWLFPGSRLGQPIGSDTVQHVFNSDFRMAF